MNRKNVEHLTHEFKLKLAEQQLKLDKITKSFKDLKIEKKDSKNYEDDVENYLVNVKGKIKEHHF